VARKQSTGLSLKAAMEEGDSTRRESSASSEERKRRASNKKEPVREEFDSEEQYTLAWTRWRDLRDHNNESVKRSRMMAKQKRDEQERLHREREAQNSELEKMVGAMKEEVKFLNKVLKTPELLDRTELKKLDDLLAHGLPASG
jgi:hypothetical protein